MNELLHGKGKQVRTPEDEERAREMERLREEIKEARAQRVQLIQDLHC
jgi:hypothetical protein